MDEASRDQILYRDLYTMAPTITAAMTDSQEHLTLNHKLRKPLVEKLRRERINSSIEQLKSLLGPEFLKQQPESKLEKADILQKTVCFLTQLLQQNKQQEKLLTHLNKPKSFSDDNLREADFSPLNSTVQTSISKDKSLFSSALWRPW